MRRRSTGWGVRLSESSLELNERAPTTTSSSWTETSGLPLPTRFGLAADGRSPGRAPHERAQPSLIGRAVEEILRFEPPVVQTARITTVDVKIGGCPIRLGESVLVSLVAANRDPDVYRDPDRFDITREDVHHHSFGGGVHFCLGAPLARLEASLAIAAVLRRFPGLRVAEEAVEWRSTPSFRGLTRLHVLV